MNPILRELTLDNRELTDRVRILEGANELLKDEATVLDRENRSLKRDMDLELLTIHNLEKAKTKAVNTAASQASYARLQIELRDVEIAESRGQNTYLRESIAGFKVEQAKLRKQVREAQPEVLQGDIEKLKKDVAWFQDMYQHKCYETDHLCKEKRELQQKNNELIVARDHAEARAEMWKGDIQGYAKQYQVSEGRRRIAEAQNTDMQRKHEAEIRIATNHAHGDGWSAGYKLGEDSERVERLQKENAELRNKEITLKGLIQDVRLENSAIQRRFQAFKKGDTLLEAQSKISAG